MALSQSMRDVIPLMNLLEEFGKIIVVKNIPPMIKWKIFEDNVSCIKVATAPNITPRTKHIALKYHFFCSYVQSGKITRCTVVGRIGLRELSCATCSLLLCPCRFQMNQSVWDLY